MKKNKKNRLVKLERKINKICIILTIFLVIGIIYSRATLGKINLEVQELSDIIDEKTETNQSLIMKINEMVSLDKIQEVSKKEGLKYNNENVKSVTE